MIVEIDKYSGFCFGVKNAIETATGLLNNAEKVYCVGDIVHNEAESLRLSGMGMSIIDKKEIDSISEGTILFRAHGEPPSAYSQVKNAGLTLKDATCPVVLKLQQRILKAYIEQKKHNGQIVIFGKRGHAEVVGLIGQTNNEAIVIESELEIGLIDMNRPVELFAQTTKSPETLQLIVRKIKEECACQVVWHNTTCKQVTGRVPRIKEFAKRFDAVAFVGGKISSNAKVLFSACKEANSKSYFVSSASDIKPEWFGAEIENVGVCGATSTPNWLMEEVSKKIEALSH